jgi:hypothetical protein
VLERITRMLLPAHIGRLLRARSLRRRLEAEPRRIVIGASGIFDADGSRPTLTSLTCSTASHGVTT